MKEERKEKNQLTQKTHSAEENIFFINWIKTKTYQVFSYSEADAYKCKKQKASWSLIEMNSKEIFYILSDNYGSLKVNQQHEHEHIQKSQFHTFYHIVNHNLDICL